MIYQLRVKVTHDVQYTIVISGKENVQLSILEDASWGTAQLSTLRTIYYWAIFDDFITLQVNSKEAVTICFSQTINQVFQIYMSNVLKQAFYADLKNRYKLTDYVDIYVPTLFYGLMNKTDIQTLRKHRSLAIIIWVGGDIVYNIQKKLTIIKTLPRMKHLAISSFIEADLIRLGVPYVFSPLMGIDFQLYHPVSKGSAIYLYTDPNAETTYGCTYYRQLMKKYAHIPFIVTCCKVTYDRMCAKNQKLPYRIQWYDKATLINQIYPQCFIGLRLTTHDGLAGTVQELGLLGIKCIHNGTSPSALPYQTYEDICNHIDAELLHIHTTDRVLAEKVKSYLSTDIPTIMNQFIINR